MCYKPTLLNGTLSPDGNVTVGNTTTAICEEGFRIAGSSDNAVMSAVLTCGINGTWNRTVECEPKGTFNVCGHLVVPHVDTIDITLWVYKTVIQMYQSLNCNRIITSFKHVYSACRLFIKKDPEQLLNMFMPNEKLFHEKCPHIAITIYLKHM